ncbi:MAG: hypothetical protein PWP37_1600 [Thermotogota bacterium]|nr:hypothetical protein [Thermotogota bacterium]MDK2865408.1 hypothetical protein [Thermotogota bacterium]HCZ07163.1 sugar ABC transporter permease [Thermotogota bacterium]
MLKKRNVREAIAGYLFASPIIIAILVFTIVPIFQAGYYSFTDYDALLQQKYRIRFNAQEALENYFFVSPDEAPSDEELLSLFDPVDFIELSVGVDLDDRQKELVRKEFNSRKLIADFLEFKLDRIYIFSDFMKSYMKNGASTFSRYVPQFVGLSNFLEAFKDRMFWISLKNAVVFSLVVTPIQTLLAIVLAVAANQRIRGVKFFKVSFFLPSITSAAAISMIFLLIYSKPGVLNRLLGYLGIGPVDWLGNIRTALPSIMAMNIWTTAGYFMVTFLAGLQDIPTSIIEASMIDGANAWVRFWRITIPMLRNQIIFVVTMGIIGTLQVFDQIYFLIRNQENITISMYIYQNAFSYGKMGYASAIAMILFLIIFSVTFVQRRLMPEERF